MNTVDPQAPYGKPTERAPMLSDEALMDIVIDKYGGTDSYTQDRCFAVAEAVRDLFLAKITSGELRVVKEVRNCNSASVCFTCSSCCVSMYKVSFLNAKEGAMRHCPNCGGKIVVL